MSLKDIYQKWQIGEKLTDEELQYALPRATTLEENLRELGPEFIHPWRDIRNWKEWLTLVSNARKHK